MRTFATTAVLALILANSLSAQEVMGRSNTLSLRIERPPKLLIMRSKEPEISLSLSFTEPSGNGRLDPDEKGSIKVSVKNTGTKPAKNVRLVAVISPPAGGVRVLSIPTDIGDLKPGEFRLGVVVVGYDGSGTVDQVTASLTVTETSGLECDPPREITIGVKRRL